METYYYESNIFTHATFPVKKVVESIHKSKAIAAPIKKINFDETLCEITFLGNLSKQDKALLDRLIDSIIDEFTGRTKSKPTWTMKGGDEIYIEDMGSEHLMNCLKMLIRRAEMHRIRMVSALMTCGMLPREFTTEFDVEYDKLLETDWKDFIQGSFEPLYEELVRRGGRAISDLDDYTERIRENGTKLLNTITTNKDSIDEIFEEININKVKDKIKGVRRLELD